jgi:ATP-binding cassette, subfamily B, bacterial
VRKPATASGYRRSGRPVALVGAFTTAWRAGRAAFAGQIAEAVLTGLAPVATAWLLRAILDDLVGPRERNPLVLLAVLLGLAAGIGGLLPNVGQYLSAQSGRAVQRTATAELFAAVARLAGLRRLEDPGFQDRLRVAEQAGSSGSSQVVSGSIAILQSGLTLGGFLMTLLLLSPVMAAVVAVAAIPAIFLERGMARQRVAMITGISHSQRRQLFYASLLVSDAAAKEIRLFGLGGFFRARMLDELSHVQRAGRQVDRRVLAANTGLAAISALVTAGGLLWAVVAARAGRLTVGDVSIFVVALGSVASALGMIISAAATTYQAVLMLRTYQGVLAEGPDLPIAAHPLAARPLRHGIEMNDVWFRYGPDQPWILRGVTFCIPHGRSLALVGHNGAGKSTLVKLLCRFYDPDRGAITWDGIDLRDLDPGDLRDRISVVFQDYMTYELSAAENISVGDLLLAGHDERLAAAGRRAGVHDALAALPWGYQTLLTRTYFDLADRDDPRTGVLLSGGQWQRVALARAFLRGGRDLMILDEPSAGLDAEAEHEIHAGLTADRADRATVLISHRLNTVRDADHIVVLSDGLISEQGDHDALMAWNGTYARLFSLQATGYAAEPAAAGRAND